MRHYPALLSLLALAAFGNATAFAAPEAKAPAANLVPRDEWMESLVTVLPSVFCAREGYFRSCFKLSEDQCLEQGVRATKSCLIKIKDELPAQLKQPDEGRAWGQKAGACSGGTLELALKTQGLERTDRKDCADPDKWAPKTEKPAKK
jgi:hypothetical protein